MWRHGRSPLQQTDIQEASPPPRKRLAGLAAPQSGEPYFRPLQSKKMPIERRTATQMRQSRVTKRKL
jgi:hypothetical protein